MICEKDNGNLWGKSLWSPIVVIDRKTRTVVANEKDNEGILRKRGELYVGYFPENKIIANSTVKFGGKHYTMVAYPLPETKYGREHLFLHEMFHRLQGKLNLTPPGGYGNNHLDKTKARILMKLEWSALEKAIKCNNAGRRASINDALIFRNYRRQLYADCDSMENKFELHEGLPEYTAFTLLAESENKLKKKLLSKKDNIWKSESYIRVFGYVSGALYAYLLNQTGAKWKKDLKYNDNLGILLQKEYNIEVPDDVSEQYDKIKNKYDFDKINDFELNLQQKKDSILALLREKFTVKPIVIIDLQSPNIGFDPSALQALDSIGTVFPNIKLVDEFGILKVEKGGCLMSNDWKKAYIPAEFIKIKQNIIETPSWSLKLNKNWIIQKKNGNFIVFKQG